MALAVLQLIGIGWSALVLQRWWQQPAHQPRGAWRSRFWHLGRPVGLPLLVAALFLVGLPKVYAGASFGAIVAADPDMGDGALLSSSLALGWGLLRTVGVLVLLRHPGTGMRVTNYSLPSATSGAGIKSWGLEL
ncbi:MAG: hypothetical protein M3300_11340 [Actinomycetota bacterium]|nr:hypothetical protein [Actinomycetota bacterium]